MTDPWAEETPAREGGKRPLVWLLSATASERSRIARALVHEGLAIHDGEVPPDRAPALAIVALPDLAEAVETRLAGHGCPVLAVIDAEGLPGLGGLGVSDFLARPLGEVELRERVRLLLRRSADRQARLRAQERLEGAQRLARSGSFEVALTTGGVEASLPMFELLGLLPRQGQGVAELCALPRSTGSRATRTHPATLHRGGPRGCLRGARLPSRRYAAGPALPPDHAA